MMKNEKTLTPSRIVIALVALIALVAGTVLLYSFSYAPLAMVFIPIAVALVGGVALVLINRNLFDLAFVLSLIGTAVNGYFLAEHGIESVKSLAYIPAIVFFVVFLILRDMGATKEAIRKFLVSVKRNPQFIPLVMMLVTFLFYSLNLTAVSNTTAKIQGKGMGLSEFAIMLLSMLCMVCMLNAFPRRKKANVPMVVLTFVLIGIIVFCDFHYQDAIFVAVSRTENPIKVTKDTAYIYDAYDMLSLHMILMFVTAALVALLPVYRKLLKKINTSVAVEYSDDMAEIEINE